MAMSILQLLQDWYSRQCDGQWEHSFGIKIDTIDNPGWSVKIDLAETELSEKQVPEFKSERGSDDWIICSLKAGTFYGYGDPSKLESIISYFLENVVDAGNRK